MAREGDTRHGQEEQSLQSLPLPSGVIFEQLGSQPLGKFGMSQLDVNTNLSEVDLSFVTLRRKIYDITSYLSLPSYVEAEAIAEAIRTNKIKGKDFRTWQKACYCIYIAGKRHSCVKADITKILDYMVKIDPSMTKGKLARSMWRIHQNVGKESVGATDVKLHIEQTFRALMNSRQDAFRGLASAFKRAIELEKSEELGTGSPRRRAAYLCTLALRQTDWKSYGCSEVGREDVTDASGVVPTKIYPNRI